MLAKGAEERSESALLRKLKEASLHPSPASKSRTPKTPVRTPGTVATSAASTKRRRSTAANVVPDTPSRAPKTPRRSSRGSATAPGTTAASPARSDFKSIALQTYFQIPEHLNGASVPDLEQAIRELDIVRGYLVRRHEMVKESMQRLATWDGASE